jgi:hypothetical protein
MFGILKCRRTRFAVYLGLFDTGAQRLVERFSLLVVEWVEEIHAMLIHLRTIKNFNKVNSHTNIAGILDP